MVSRCRIRPALLWAVAALAWCDASVVCAAELPVGPVVRLKPKSVRATKPLLVEDPRGDGAPIATVQGARLRHASRSVAEAAAELPGAHALQTGGPASAALLTVRGGTTDQMAVFLGDSPLPNWDGAAFDLADVPLFALDRLELHRGAVSADLGGQPIGGALRLVPRPGRASEADVRADAGSFGSNGLEAGASRRADRWRGFAGARWLRSRGDFDYLLDPGTAFDPSDDRPAVRANNDVMRVGGLAHVDGRSASGATWAATWLGAWLDQGLAGPALLQARSARYARNRQVGVVAGRADDFWATGDALAWSIGGSWLDNTVADPLGELGPARHDGTRTAGAVAAATWTSPAQLLAGGEATVLGRVETGAAQVSVREKRTRNDGQHSTRALGGGQLAARWVGAGGKVQATPSVGMQAVRSAVADTGPATALPWHASLHLRYSPTATWTVSAAARRAVRLPNLHELFADTGAVAGNPALRPETAASADLGATVASDHGRLRWAVDARGFAAHASDLIQLVQVGPHRARWQNTAAATSWGGEATLRATVATAWQMTLQHATLIARDHSQRELYRGRALPLRPRSKWLAEARWTPDAPGPLAPELWAAWHWQSAYYLDAANEVALPARALWSAGVQAASRDGVASAALRIDNLAGARNFDLVGWPLPGRSVWLTVTWHLAAGGS